MHTATLDTLYRKIADEVDEENIESIIEQLWYYNALNYQIDYDPTREFNFEMRLASPHPEREKLAIMCQTIQQMVHKELVSGVDVNIPDELLKTVAIKGTTDIDLEKFAADYKREFIDI